MRIRSLQILALAALSLTAAAFVVQTSHSDAADVCIFAASADQGTTELASLFRADGEFAQVSLIGDEAMFDTTNDIELAPENIAFVDVSNVTSCSHHGDVI